MIAAISRDHWIFLKSSAKVIKITVNRQSDKAE